MDRSSIVKKIKSMQFRAKARDVEKIVLAVCDIIEGEGENPEMDGFTPIPAPKLKKDYADNWIMLKASVGTIKSGAVCKLLRRLPAKEASTSVRLPGEPNGRWLNIMHQCHECGLKNREYIPESWIEDGKIQFVTRNKESE